MRLFVAVTDDQWFGLLRRRPELDEVCFVQPGARRPFRALAPGEPFLFKLHAPRHVVAGGGFFSCSSRLPCGLVWDAFGERCGAASLTDLRRRVARARRAGSEGRDDPEIGCVVLQDPFFLSETAWLPVPKDFSPNVGQGKTYSLGREPGGSLWERLRVWLESAPGREVEDRQAGLFGDPRPVRPRLGAGGFRILVTDAYGRRCAISRDATLQALEAAHIRPPALGGAHRVDNGLLLRADLRRLFDLGYLTVTPQLEVRASRLLRQTGGKGAYANLDGRRIAPPAGPAERPDPGLLAWHGEQVFRA